VLLRKVENRRCVFSWRIMELVFILLETVQFHNIPKCLFGIWPCSTGRYLHQTKPDLLCITAVGPRAKRWDQRPQLVSASRLAADHRSASLCDVTAAALIDINDDRLLVCLCCWDRLKSTTSSDQFITHVDCPFCRRPFLIAVLSFCFLVNIRRRLAISVM